MARERTEGCRVVEKLWNVSQLADGRVVLDRVRVVEVEAILKMIRIGRDEKNEEQQCAAETRSNTLACYAGICFRHRISLPQQIVCTQSRQLPCGGGL